MKKFLSLVVVLISGAIYAQDFEWVAVTEGIENTVVLNTAVDTDGNIYSTGSFQGTVDFDPSAASFELTAIGTNTFVHKLNSNGELVWAVSMGGANETDVIRAYGIAVDGSGNCFITGNFHGTIDFDPSASDLSIPALGVWDVFVQKLDPDGELVWAHGFGTMDFHKGISIATDAAGDCYTIGQFSGDLDLNPDDAVESLVSSAGSCTFIQKLNAAGEFVWARQFFNTPSSVVNPKEVTVDNSSNVILCGTFVGTVDFNPGISEYNISDLGGLSSGYAVKLNSDGDFVWASAYLSEGHSIAEAVKTDASNNAYIVGGFQETVDFDPSADSYNIISAGEYDMFVQKLSPAGELIWTNSHGDIGFDLAQDMDIDNDGNCYIIGDYSGTVDFDPSAGTANLTETGNFIQKVDIDGNLVWITDAFGFHISVDSELNCFAGGYFGEITIDFDPGLGVEERTGLGIVNGSIVKFSSECPINSSISLSGITLTVAETGATYQWLDCDDGDAEIPGATDQSYTAVANGNYACRITTPDCELTSDCMVITSVGIEDDLTFDFEVYPNPTNGLLHINTSEAVQSNLFSSNGQLILTTNAKQLDLSNLSSGIYILKASTSKGLVIKKIQVN